MPIITFRTACVPTIWEVGVPRGITKVFPHPRDLLEDRGVQIRLFLFFKLGKQIRKHSPRDLMKKDANVRTLGNGIEQALILVPEGGEIPAKFS